MIRFAILMLVFPLALHAAQIPRRVIAFWDVSIDKVIDESNVCRTLEMPLNYLGIDVEYHEIHEPLPDLSNRPDIRGIVISFDSETKMEHPRAFITWASEAIDKGKKVLLLGYPGFLANTKGDYTPTNELNRLYERLGFEVSNEGIEYTYDYHIVASNKEFLPFEKELPHPLLPFAIAQAKAGASKTLLSVGIPGKSDSVSDLIVLSAAGVYVAPNYGNNFEIIDFDTNARSAGWYLNPFLLLEAALDLSSLPIPDTTTLAGRRIFYSFSDGDSWNIKTSIEEYQGKDMSCAEVMLKEVIQPNPDVPMTQGVIAADIDPDWVGTAESINVLKKFAALPNVIIASHTYSHPFDWEFFRNDPNGKEIYFLYRYTFGGWQNSFLSWFRSKYFEFHNPDEAKKLNLKWGYVTPRAYANHPFDIQQEITGAVDFIDRFIPPAKAVKMVLWSGDGRPWDLPVKLCYEAHLQNFGGGSVRMDPSFPSYLFVGPLGRKPGGWIQILSSADAEINYTDNWKENFYAFKYLPLTLASLENPRRIKPIALYYHSYSGQFRASVNAVLSNLEYIRTQSTIHITNSRYFDIGQGFYSCEIESLNDKSWKIKNRQGLQTIRFDHAKGERIDLNGSQGVVGYNEHLDSLYVYLDAAVAEAVIKLGGGGTLSPYIKESSWEMWNVVRGPMITFQAKGWGKLTMKWAVLSAGVYAVSASGPNNFFQQWEIASNGNEWAAELDLPYNQEFTIEIKQKSK